jgi:hypothetical protein
MSGKTKRNLSPQEKGFFCLYVFIVALLLSSIPPQSTFARTWYIKADGTGDAPTIQAGVDSAAVGDTVLVASGTYDDTTHVACAGSEKAVNVHIYKPVVILGVLSGSRPVIGSDLSEVGIYIDSVQPVAIVHLTLKRFNSAGGFDSKRIWARSSTIAVSDIEAFGDHHGLVLENTSGEVRNSEFHDLSAGVVCYAGSTGYIRRNSLVNCDTGIDCRNSSAFVDSNHVGAPLPAAQNVGVYSEQSSVRVKGNTITWCESGVYAVGGDVLIEENIVAHHDYGVRLYSSSANILGNALVHGLWGIWATGSTGQVSNNTIDDWDAGIVSELGSNQIIQRNIISRGFWGIECLGAALTVECNDIFDMSSGLFGWNCTGQPGAGNFSADPEYCGVDDSGNYFLQSDSPCAAGNHPEGVDCGVIGALSVNCGDVPTKETTWGSMKMRYREGGDP